MKKSLLALAVLGAFAGVASAQSSVTLYGTVDVNGRYVKDDGSQKRLSMGRDGLNSSQLGFRGVEDMGGGLKAGFNLLASLNAGTGDIGGGQQTAGNTGAGNTGPGKFFSRRATVSLFSSAGELRLGRDYTPTFWNQTLFDAWGTVGIGNSENVQQMQASTNTRADNNIGYFLPSNIGGFYGQVNVAAKQGGYTGGTATAVGVSAASGESSNQGRYIGGRLGFAAGPFDIAIGAASQQTQSYFYTNGNQNIGLPTTVPSVIGFGTQKTYNAGGSYDFGFVKFEGYYQRESLNDLKESRGSVNAIIPMGQGEIHLGYNRSKLTNELAALDYRNTAWQAAATYQYNLSKRTAMYGTVAELNNGDHSRLAIVGMLGGTSTTSYTAPPVAGGKSKGFELGVRHFF